MQKLFPLKKDSVVFTVMIIIAVGIFNALCTSLFFVSHHFLTAGLGGIAMLINRLSEIPTWILLVALNVPVTLIGLFKMNLRFVLLSLLGMASFTTAYTLIGPLQPIISDSLLSAVVGGIGAGAAGSLVVRRGASMGGLDIVTFLLSKRLSVSMAVIGNAINAVILAILAIFMGLEPAMLTLISLLASQKAFDVALTGFNRTQTVFIISSRWESIAPRVIHELKRGVTFLPARGGYSGEERTIVYCIIRTVEVALVKNIVKEHDPTAIISVIDTREVVGRGFSPL